MPPPVDPVIVKKEREALNKIVKYTLAADPPSLKIFESTKVSWKVIVPSDIPYEVDIKLNGAVVGLSGKKTFPLSQSTTFTLWAVTENAKRQLRQISVNVDTSECREKVLGALLISLILKDEFDKRFNDNEQVNLRGDGTSITIGDGIISIDIPLTISVPKWFDANTNVGIQLAVGPGNPVFVSAQSVSVDVSWSFFEHLASLFCTGLVQSGMEKMAQVFISNIVDTQLVPVLKKEFNEQGKDFIKSLSDADPANREYVINLVALSSDGLKFTACPLA